MAKIRVYELARELSLKNTELLEKIGAMDIAVKSHMSSLDAEIVDKIKSNIFGKKPDGVEETRVKPTVIRRRRKSVPVEPVEAVKAAAEPEPVAEAEKAPDIAEPEKEAETVEDLKAPEHVPTEEKPAETVEAVKPPEEDAAASEPVEPIPVKKPKPGRKKKVKKELPAKIIKLPIKPEKEVKKAAKKAPKPKAAAVEEKEAKGKLIPLPKEAVPEVVPEPKEVKPQDKKRKGRKGDDGYGD